MIACRQSIAAAFGIAFAAGAPAVAVTVQVAQESAPGLADFDANILGSIESVAFTGSAADFYGNADPNNAYNGEANGGPAGILDTTQFFSSPRPTVCHSFSSTTATDRTAAEVRRRES